MSDEKEKKCCPGCEIEMDWAVGFFECGNSDCACHHPLGVSVGDTVEPEDKFGRL